MGESRNASIRETLREYYDKTARDRDSRGMQDWKSAERAAFLALLQKEGKRSLLEIGSGPGRDSKFFQDQGLEVTCIDLSPEMVALCREKGLNAFVMDIGDITFADASFDAVYSMNSLLHIPKDEFPGVLRRIDRLLRAEGLFYAGVYGGYDFEGIFENDYHHPRRFFSFYADEHLKTVLAQVFEMVSFKTVPVEGDEPLHFQSFILRKKKESTAAQL